jgi:hypothetical protein
MPWRSSIFETRWRGHQVAPDRVMRPHQLPGRFHLGSRDRDRRQLPRQQQAREQFGVLAVGLDAIRGRARRLARRDHRHLDPAATAVR